MKKFIRKKGEIFEFDYVDMNQDNIKMYAVGHHFALCINDMSTSYIVGLVFSYYRERDKHMGTFGCEFKSLLQF